MTPLSISSLVILLIVLSLFPSCWDISIAVIFLFSLISLQISISFSLRFSGSFRGRSYSINLVGVNLTSSPPCLTLKKGSGLPFSLHESRISSIPFPQVSTYPAWWNTSAIFLLRLTDPWGSFSFSTVHPSGRMDSWETERTPWVSKAQQEDRGSIPSGRICWDLGEGDWTYPRFM